MRLDRWLVEAGVGPRRTVADLVRDGRVFVDGSAVFDPGCPVSATAAVTVDGRPWVWVDGHTWLVHKAEGYVTSTDSHDGIPIIQLLPARLRHLAWKTVGRLDKDVTGLVVLTTDGELAHRLTHPRWEVGKTYIATLARPATVADVAAFAYGLTFRGSGEELRPAELSWGDDPTTVTLVLHEGRYHQVKRMFRARENDVLTLRRVAHGPVGLPDDLPVGGARPATADELAALRAVVRLDDPAAP